MKQATLIPFNLKGYEPQQNNSLGTVGNKLPGGHPVQSVSCGEFYFFVCVVCSTDREGQYDSYLNGGIMALFCCVMPIVFRHI